MTWHDMFIIRVIQVDTFGWVKINGFLIRFVNWFVSTQSIYHIFSHQHDANPTQQVLLPSLIYFVICCKCYDILLSQFLFDWPTPQSLKLDTTNISNIGKKKVGYLLQSVVKKKLGYLLRSVLNIRRCNPYSKLI